jgi:hypothetical protein
MGSRKIVKLEDEQWKKAPGHVDKWLNYCIEPVDSEKARLTMHELYGQMGYAPPTVLIAPSPSQTSIQTTLESSGVDQSQLGKNLGTLLEEHLWSYLVNPLIRQRKEGSNASLYREFYRRWGHILSCTINHQLTPQLERGLAILPCNGLQAYCPFKWSYFASGLDFFSSVGVELDTNKLTTLISLCRQVMAIVPLENVAIVCDRPTTIEWRGDGELHNVNGPAAIWSDGWSLWSIDGVAVDEQIVMRPETQTVEQINAETNLEVKGVRISQFGWLKYLEQCLVLSNRS